MAAETYNDLIFKLGDLARERLPNKPNCPRSMDRVYRAEEALVARQDELAALEEQMNAEDTGYAEFLAQQDEEKAKLSATVKRWKKAVEGIEGRVKDLRKKISSRKAELRYQEIGIKKEERKLSDLELEGRDLDTIETIKINLKKTRLLFMRGHRDVEEMEREFSLILTPRPGQVGADGIIAHGRLIELEDEATARKEEFERVMGELDQAIAEKEEELRAAEDYLDQALFLLGEDCYAQRIADPALSVMYPKIDKLAG
ncbi:MAG: hypothetical protein ACJ790_17645 [Myxococcaceae bacterium]